MVLLKLYKSSRFTFGKIMIELPVTILLTGCFLFGMAVGIAIVLVTKGK